MTRATLLSLTLAAALAAAPALAQSNAAPAAAARASADPASAATAATSGASAAQQATAATAGTAASAPPSAAEATVPAAGATPDSATAATAPARSGPLAMTIPTPQPAAPAGSLLQTTIALLFVLALLVGGAWFLKRFGPKNFGGGNGNIKLVGSLSLGTRERILLVEVGDQWIVVGASPGRMNALATMARQEHADTTAPATLQTANFADWFKQTIDKRNGK